MPFSRSRASRAAFSISALTALLITSIAMAPAASARQSLSIDKAVANGLYVVIYVTYTCDPVGDEAGEFGELNGYINAQGPAVGDTDDGIPLPLTCDGESHPVSFAINSKTGKSFKTGTGALIAASIVILGRNFEIPDSKNLVLQ